VICTKPHQQLAVMMMGTDPQGAGGIASVLKAYALAGLFDPPQSTVTCVTTHRAGPPWRVVLLWLKAMLTLVIARTRGQATIVHAHSASRGSFLRKSILLWMARRLGSHTVFHLHGGGFQAFVEHQTGPLGRRWVKHTLSHVSLILTLSERWRDYIRTIAPNTRVEILPNPVALEVSPLREPEPGRILFLGRIDPRKGIYDLVDAIAAIGAAQAEGRLESLPTLRLVVGGDGDSGALADYASRAGVGAQLELLGWIGPDERARQLTRAASFILPSHHEGLPMSMLEAMAARVPIIVSSVGGIPDLVTHGVHGLIVPPGDIKALADAISILIANAELQETLARAARTRIRAECATDLVLARLRLLWQTLNAEASPNPIVKKVPT
jgi:glycosyltransferase involved in cell wall biosynthesis